MKKAIIIVIIAVIIGVIFLAFNTISQNEDIESIGGESINSEELEVEPQGRNISIQLDEDMGFSAP